MKQLDLSGRLRFDPSHAREVARGFALDYLQTENYARNLRRMGWTDADLRGRGSDALIDAVVAWGDADRIAVRVRQHLDAGRPVGRRPAPVRVDPQGLPAGGRRLPV